MWVFWIERLENHWIDRKQICDKIIGAYREAMKTVMLECRGIKRVYEETEEEHSMCEMRWRLGSNGLVSFFSFPAEELPLAYKRSGSRRSAVE